MKICIIGAAGGIGQPLSLMLTKQLPYGYILSLYDINPLINGIVKDLNHIPSNITIAGNYGDDLKLSLHQADIVLIAAGVTRKMGMERSDLLSVNADIICKLIQKIMIFCPEAMLGVITNPINTIVPIIVNKMKKIDISSKNRIFGITTLDVIRSNTFIGKLKHQKPYDINTIVVGGHSGATIIPLLSKIPNITFSAEEIQYLFNKIQNAGTEIIKAKNNSGSATLSMAYAAYKFCLSLIDALNGKNNVIECAYVESNCEYSSFFAYPVHIGKNGIQNILSIKPINQMEVDKIKNMLPILHLDISMSNKYIN
uniref:Malate dehydrogenase n=1 Tax=Candidatus Aschnera chinzeii TaxID=1485666 RepID=A0AAT9G4B3_9ENTR|nr:MAG: malate dehydrogenase [Candidatus Aschnera chinzeii]